MNLLECPVCDKGLHIKEYKIRGNPIPEGFLFCHSSNPIHFIGTMINKSHDRDPRETILKGYIFLDNYVVSTWSNLRSAIVFKRLKKLDPIKIYKNIMQSNDAGLDEGFFLDVDVDSNILIKQFTNEFIENYLIIS